MYYTPPSVYADLNLLIHLPMPKATLLTCSVSTKAPPALLLAQPSTPKHRCTLGSVVGMARTDARSDHAVLELFCCFFLSREKSKTRIIGKRLNLSCLQVPQHSKQITLL